MLSPVFLRRVPILLAVTLFLLASGPIPAHMQAPYTVAILVVDDFGSTDLADVEAAPADNCAVSLESQAFAVRGVSAVPITVPHGDLVYAELQGLLEDVGASDSIELVQVDIQGMTTDVAAAQIAAALDATDADFYVLNMSFAIIPCDYVQAFADYQTQLLSAENAKDLKKHRDLFQRAVIFYNGTVYPAMSQRAQTEQNLDPLQTLFVDWGANVIPVASAGNFGLDFPFWPGTWGQVVSVSGSTGDGFYTGSAWDKKKDDPLLKADVTMPNKNSRISNYGEVMMPGEYNSEAAGLVSGTSFAAPRLSVALALYVSQVGSGMCRNDEDGPGLAYGSWDNLTLVQAVQEYCPAMQAYLP
jgi:hypothetical protein